MKSAFEWRSSELAGFDTFQAQLPRFWPFQLISLKCFQLDRRLARPWAS